MMKNIVAVKECSPPPWKMKKIVSFLSLLTITTQLVVFHKGGGVSSFIIPSSSSLPKRRTRRRRTMPSLCHVNQMNKKSFETIVGYDSYPSTLIVINYALNEDDDLEEEKGPSEKSNLSWLKDSMGLEQQEEKRSVLPLEEGLAGFAVDPHKGFLAILASSSKQQQKFTYVVISPNDRERVTSAEALCMVQLAGGLDLGTAIFPPDILAKLAVGEVDDISSTQELRKRISLLDIHVVPNDDNKSTKTTKKQTSNSANNDTDGTFGYSSLISSKERERQIIQSAPKVLKAIKGLPGLQECTIGDVLEGLQTHANEIGEIDQTSFPNLLETLRQGKRSSTSVVKQSHIKFLLKVNFLENERLSQHTIVSPTPLHAIGLSMRYKIPLNIDNQCFSVMDHNNSKSTKVCFDASDILDKFPQFRPLQELREDAAIMDGFIPSMFVKASYLDNDDKQ